MQQFESVGKVSKEIHGTMAKIMATPVATVIISMRENCAQLHLYLMEEKIEQKVDESGE